jgi:RNA polymerase sigma-70 factor (ECF subfamily)
MWARCYLTDAELLNGARLGDAESWRTLYERYLPFVWRQAHALLGDIHAAEDVTSEVMVALLRNIHNLESDVPKFGGWLRAVVRCKAADHQRALIRARNKLSVVANESAAAGPNPQHAPSAPLEVVETKERVHHALDALSDRQRIVLEWKYLESLPVREMAERLGETEKAVEAVLYRARREFRRLFDSQRLLDTAVAKTPPLPLGDNRDGGALEAAEGKTEAS